MEGREKKGEKRRAEKRRAVKRRAERRREDESIALASQCTPITLLVNSASRCSEGKHAR